MTKYSAIIIRSFVGYVGKNKSYSVFYTVYRNGKARMYSIDNMTNSSYYRFIGIFTEIGETKQTVKDNENFYIRTYTYDPSAKLLNKPLELSA
jgi:hypothetical protein